MALCHPSLPDGKGKLILTDAENAWFVRVNHLEQYGTDVHLERLAAEPPEPLLFLNIDAVPGSRALAWEHIEDASGKRCPNPRVIIPRKAFPGVVEGAVTVDIRSFGVRTLPMRQRAAQLRHPRCLSPGLEPESGAEGGADSNSGKGTGRAEGPRRKTCRGQELIHRNRDSHEWPGSLFARGGVPRPAVIWRRRRAAGPDRRNPVSLPP